MMASMDNEVGLADGSILYRAHRVRFIIAAVFLVPFTVAIIVLGYDGIFLGDSDVRGVWVLMPMAFLFTWLDCMVVAKLIRPPELEVSTRGIRWANCNAAEERTLRMARDRRARTKHWR